MTSAVVIRIGVALYSSKMAVTSSLLRDSKRGPRAIISSSASSAATPPAMVAATSLEALKPIPLDASLQAAKTVLIVMIVEVGLINWLIGR
jgi:hypothetical protein